MKFSIEKETRGEASTDTVTLIPQRLKACVMCDGKTAKIGELCYQCWDDLEGRDYEEATEEDREVYV